MKPIEKILVGVDLAQGDRLVSPDLPPPTAEAVERALWLAKLTSARVTFFYAIDVSGAARRLIERAAGVEETVLGEATDVLLQLVEKAEKQGVAADYRVRFGKSWGELIVEVLREKHDLVMAGTRHLPALRGALLGSTGVKLLRLCPTPVCIVQPRDAQPIRSILVAHCLEDVGAAALDYGCWLARLSGAELHVLHALETHGLVGVLPENIAEEQTAEQRSAAGDQIASQLQQHKLDAPATVHIVDGPPAPAILDHIRDHDVDLLIMGTIARSGLAGAFFGNAAERLLPEISCSLLAIKPSDFVSPVTLEGNY